MWLIPWIDPCENRTGTCFTSIENSSVLYLNDLGSMISRGLFAFETHYQTQQFGCSRNNAFPPFSLLGSVLLELALTGVIWGLVFPWQTFPENSCCGSVCGQPHVEVIRQNVDLLICLKNSNPSSKGNPSLKGCQCLFVTFYSSLLCLLEKLIKEPILQLKAFRLCYPCPIQIIFLHHLLSWRWRSS